LLIPNMWFRMTPNTRSRDTWLIDIAFIHYSATDQWSSIKFGSMSRWISTQI